VAHDPPGTSASSTVVDLLRFVKVVLVVLRSPGLNALVVRSPAQPVVPDDAVPTTQLETVRPDASSLRTETLIGESI
jgi:hypothetical protein